jgi:hypothetical protein
MQIALAKTTVFEVTSLLGSTEGAKIVGNFLNGVELK